MNIKAICIVISITLLLTLLFVAPVSAHPGRTASDGCHYCRTNCDRWGVPWNERHCHGTKTPPTYTLPTSAPLPTASPTSKPTTPMKCDDNLWTFLALGKQACRYGFWDFATGWGLVYGVVGFVIYSFFKKK